MATRTFRGAVDSDWNDLGNWLEGAVPIAGDDVVFDASSPSCVVDVATAYAGTFICTGFINNFNLNGQTIEIDGLTWTLVAGMTFTHGNGEIEFSNQTATVNITMAGKTVYTIRLTGLNGTTVFEQQDAIICQEFLYEGGVDYSTNDNNITTVDMHWDTSLAAASRFYPGSSTVTVSGDMTWDTKNVMSTAGEYGTSTFVLSGSGRIGVLASSANMTIYFYNLQIADNGQTTTFYGGHSSTTVYARGQLKTGTGILAWSDSLGDFAVHNSTLETPFDGDPLCQWNVPLLIDYNEHASGGDPDFVYFTPCEFKDDLEIKHQRKESFRIIQTAPLVVDGLFLIWVDAGFVSGATHEYDAGGFDITLGDDATFGAGTIDHTFQFRLDGSTLSIAGDMQHWGSKDDVGCCMFYLINGHIIVTGNVNVDIPSGYTPTILSRIAMSGNSSVQVGGYFDAAGFNRNLFQEEYLGNDAEFEMTGTSANIFLVDGDVLPTIVLNGGQTWTWKNGVSIKILGGIRSDGAVTFVSDSPATQYGIALVTGSLSADMGSSSFTDLDAADGFPVEAYGATVSNCINVADDKTTKIADILLGGAAFDADKLEYVPATARREMRLALLLVDQHKFVTPGDFGPFIEVDSGGNINIVGGNLETNGNNNWNQNGVYIDAAYGYVTPGRYRIEFTPRDDDGYVIVGPKVSVAQIAIADSVCALYFHVSGRVYVYNGTEVYPLNLNIPLVMGTRYTLEWEWEVGPQANMFHWRVYIRGGVWTTRQLLFDADWDHLTEITHRFQIVHRSTMTDPWEWHEWSRYSGLASDDPIIGVLDKDAGEADRPWQMNSIRFDKDVSGLQFSYAYGNLFNPTNWSAYMTLATLQAQSNPSGRYFRLRIKVTSDGNTQRSPSSGTILYTIAVGAAAGGRRTHTRVHNA